MTSTERVAVLGTGLIGTSIAMAALGAGSEVRGYDADPGVREAAALRGGFEPAEELEGCVRDASLVFVCTPIPTIPELATRALTAAPGAVVSDVGSVKTHVVAEVQAGAPASTVDRFVGGHPMGGSERSGPDGAAPSLLDGIAWVLTPTDRTAAHASDKLASWVSGLGAQAILMEPERHDRLVAMVSHLPQVASTALMGLAAHEEAGEPEILLLAAGGFRDLTRLAASSPALWSDILLANREALARAIDLYRDRLAELRDLVSSERASDLEEAFAEAKAARLNLTAKPQVKAGVAVLQVPVPDRPGVLAELTATLGSAGVNIEDLQIVHSPEGGRGTVHLTIASESAGAATRSLSARDFDPIRLA